PSHSADSAPGHKPGEAQRPGRSDWIRGKVSTMPACGNCDRPSSDGAELCSTCGDGLAERLGGVPELVEDLLVTLAKHDQLASGAGRGRNEQPLPLRLDIPDAIWVLGNVLTTWARHVARTAGLRVDASRLRRPVRAGVTDVAMSRTEPRAQRC